MSKAIRYSVDTANEREILEHLRHCDSYFLPRLSESVDLLAYSNKIRLNAKTFEAWTEDHLIGLVAVYLNDPEKNRAFITNVSVYPEFSGKKIAKTLILLSIEASQNLSFEFIILEVHKKNRRALGLYKKFTFKQISERADLLQLALNLRTYQKNNANA